MAEFKPKFSAKASLTITLASLASSTTKVGRQSTMVDNSTTRYKRIHIFSKATTGTSPTAGKGIYLHALRGNDPASSTFRTDGAGASDAALTVNAAEFIAGVTIDATSDKTYQFSGILENPGPEWGVAEHHDTGVALNATAGNHDISWVGEIDESV